MYKILLSGFFILIPVIGSAQQTAEQMNAVLFEATEEPGQKEMKTAGDDLYYFQRLPPINLVNLLGAWEKTFSTEDGREKRDPDWTLKIVFQNDGQFFYNNTFIEQISFLNKIGEKTTRPISQDIAMKGTYKIVQNSLYLDFNTQSAADIEALGLSLGLHPNSRQIVITIDQQREFLVLQAVDSSKKIFLTKTY